jgi:dTDP-4-dehydrorhamnose reductase
MTWLIIGGTGQLGIALSQELGNRGELFKSWGSGDLNITSGPSVLSAITSLKPTVIVNCAAWTDVDGAERQPDDAFQVNALGAENVALAAKVCGANLIHISTDYVFSGDSESPWKISDIRNPKSAYGRSKLAGEEKVLASYSEGTLLLRTAWLYSPWKKNFMTTVLRMAAQDSAQIKMVNDQIGQPTSAIDLAIRIITLADRSIKNGIFHATNSGQASWFDFAKEIMQIHGEDVTRLIPVPSSEFNRLADRPRFSVLDHENWAMHALHPMQDWKLALRNTMLVMELEEAKGPENA